MAQFVLFLIFCQALGALTGAVTALWGEMAYVFALRDGKIDVAERSHLRIIGHGLRWGMTLLLLSSFALVVVSYVSEGMMQPALTSSYWIFIALALLIIIISSALARRRISFAFGSAATFTAWWFLFYLAFGLLPAITFGVAVAIYVVLVGIMYALFSYIRFLVLDRTTKRRSPKKV